MRILLAGGGTGGHVFPALTIAQEIKGKHPDAEFLFIGTERGVESKVIPGAGFPLKTIATIGIPRDISGRILVFPFALLWSIWESFTIEAGFMPDIVIGTGGYVSGPVGLAAYLLGIPLVIQEQNSLPGFTTRVLATMSGRIFLTFPESARYFSKRKLSVHGNPTRRELGSLCRSEGKRRLGLREDLRTLLIIGGSQGSRAINNAVLDGLSAILGIPDLQLVWQSGSLDFERLSEATSGVRDRVFVREFIEDMASALAAADLVAARSGAMTLAEIAVCGLPSILIPLPFAAGDHQRRNSESFRRRGAAVVILQDELTGMKFSDTVVELLSDPDRIQSMSTAARKLGRPDAAAMIADRILDYMKGGKES